MSVDLFRRRLGALVPLLIALLIAQAMLGGVVSTLHAGAALDPRLAAICAPDGSDAPRAPKDHPTPSCCLVGVCAPSVAAPAPAAAIEPTDRGAIRIGWTDRAAAEAPPRPLRAFDPRGPPAA